MNDELDHLGAYFVHNNYPSYAEKLGSIESDGRTANTIGWGGYREKIDRYFSDKLHDPRRAEPPRQQIPESLTEIIEILAKQGKPGRTRTASYLLDFSGEARIGLHTNVSRVVQEFPEIQRTRPISLFGEMCVTAICYCDGMQHADTSEMRNYALSELVGNSEPMRLLLQLTYDDDRKLVDVESEFLMLKDVSVFQRVALSDLIRKYEQTRIRTTLNKAGQSKLSRNEQCPCGSGRKVKNCHKEFS